MAARSPLWPTRPPPSQSSTTLEKDEQTVTADLTLHYLRPVTEGKLTARARVLRGGRRVATVSVEIFDESGALVVTALTTYIKLR